MKFKRLLLVILALAILLTACASKPVAPSQAQTEPERTVSEETLKTDAETEALTVSTPDTESDTDPPAETEAETTTEAETITEAETEPPADIPEGTESEVTQIRDDLPVLGEYYYDVENVVLYLVLYDELPPNYITKNDARKLGWEGGSVEKYKDGAAIGGDRFGNYEGQLPKANGRTYTECDIDTNGYSSRGSRRLIFSNDGLYFYTSDHYEHFKEVTVTEDYEVIW